MHMLRKHAGYRCPNPVLHFIVAGLQACFATFLPSLPLSAFSLGPQAGSQLLSGSTSGIKNGLLSTHDVCSIKHESSLQLSLQSLRKDACDAAQNFQTLANVRGIQNQPIASDADEAFEGIEQSWSQIPFCQAILQLQPACADVLKLIAVLKSCSGNELTSDIAFDKDVAAKHDHPAASQSISCIQGTLS